MPSATTGMFPSGSPKKPEPKCTECKRLLAGIDKIAHSQFHWQALAQARLLLHPPEDNK